MMCLRAVYAARRCLTRMVIERGKMSSEVSTAETISDAPQPRSTVFSRWQRSPRLRNAVAFWGLAGPLVLGLLIFVYIPIIWGLILSFANAQATVFPTSFVGFSNYISMLKDADFQKAIVTFTLFAVFIVPTTFVLSLGLALLVNSARFLRGFFRSVFFLPTAISYTAACVVWRMSIFNGLPYGLLNMVLGLFNISPIAWIGTPNPPWYWLVLVTVRLWLQVGFYMIIFLAGLQEIPRSLYEAAAVDGARRGWATFRSITLPMLRNTSISVLLLLLIAAFQAFDEFYNILTGYGSMGNINLARTPLMYLYQVSFGQLDFGRGDAGSFILTLVIVVFTLIQGRIFGFGRSEQ